MCLDLTAAVERKCVMIGDCIFDIASQGSLPSASLVIVLRVMVDEQYNIIMSHMKIISCLVGISYKLYRSVAQCLRIIILAAIVGILLLLHVYINIVAN